VVLELTLELVELAGESRVRGEQFAQLHEGAHDVDAHPHGAGAVEDGGGHDGAVFGEGERRKSGIAMLLRTAHKLWPVQCLGLGPGEPLYEVFSEALGVGFDGLVQHFGGHAIESGKLGIEDGPLAGH
jgi:hypothetical protein